MRAVSKQELADRMLFLTDLSGRRVRLHFAGPVKLGGGVWLAQIEGVLAFSVPAPFAGRTLSICDVSVAFDPEGRDVTEGAGLLGASIVASLGNLTAMQVLADAETC
jgi:hypothetical protein